MGKAILIGSSIGLLAGVLIGTVGGTSHPVEVLFQMVFCTIGGLLAGVCYGVLTRKKGAGETFLPSQQQMVGASSEGGFGGSTVLLWVVPIISVLAALIKGIMLGAQLGR